MYESPKFIVSQFCAQFLRSSKIRHATTAVEEEWKMAKKSAGFSELWKSSRRYIEFRGRLTHVVFSRFNMTSLVIGISAVFTLCDTFFFSGPNSGIDPRSSVRPRHLAARHSGGLKSDFAGFTFQVRFQVCAQFRIRSKWI